VADRIEGLRHALELTPENHALRLVLAESLVEEGRTNEATEEYGHLHAAGELPPSSFVDAGAAALSAGRTADAQAYAEAAAAAGLIAGVGELRRAIDESLGLSGMMRVAQTAGPDGIESPIEFEYGRTVTFDDIGGLEDVKHAIHRTIILPFQRPDLYETYGRRAGGGVLLYGPPGCGKTMLARATASECGLPFSNVRIEEILDPFIGVSERNLHDMFEQARRAAPCVLFIDELDAIGFARRKHVGSASQGEERRLGAKTVRPAGLGCSRRDLLDGPVEQCSRRGLRSHPQVPAQGGEGGEDGLSPGMGILRHEIESVGGAGRGSGLGRK